MDVAEIGGFLYDGRLAHPSICTLLTVGGEVEVICFLDRLLGFEWEGVYGDSELREIEGV